MRGGRSWELGLKAFQVVHGRTAQRALVQLGRVWAHVGLTAGTPEFSEPTEHAHCSTKTHTWRTEDPMRGGTAT